MEVDQLDFTVKIFNQRSATLHPVTAIQVFHAVDLLHFGAVNMAANDAGGAVAARHGRQSCLVLGHKLDRRLGLEFQKCRQRPVAETHHPPQPVEVKVDVENPVVQVGTQLFQQMIEMRQAIRLMPVNHEVFFPVRSRMHGLARHCHAAEPHAHELLDEFVVVAGDINDRGLLAAFSQQLLNQHVVIIAPKPPELQFPTVNEIADQIQIFAIHFAQEFQQLAHPRMARAQMDVGDPD